MAETETKLKLCRRDGLLRKETGHNGRKRRLLWKKQKRRKMSSSKELMECNFS